MQWPELVMHIMNSLTTLKFQIPNTFEEFVLILLACGFRI